jgi:hypothetical protein
MTDGCMDVLGCLPFEVACTLTRYLDVRSCVALMQTSHGMRRLMAASGVYDPQRHVRFGDVNAVTKADLLSLRGIRVLVGNVTCGHYEMARLIGDLLDLFALEIVVGNMRFRHCALLTTVAGLEALTVVTGDLEFRACTLLRNTDALHLLTNVGCRLMFEHCYNLQRILVPSLVRVGGHIVIFGCIALKDISGMDVYEETCAQKQSLLRTSFN